MKLRSPDRFSAEHGGGLLLLEREALWRTSNIGDCKLGRGPLSIGGRQQQIQQGAKMGITAMAVGGALGIVAKGTTNRLMKVSLRRGESEGRAKLTRSNESR